MPGNGLATKDTTVGGKVSFFLVSLGDNYYGYK